MLESHLETERRISARYDTLHAHAWGGAGQCNRNHHHFELLFAGIFTGRRDITIGLNVWRKVDCATPWDAAGIEKGIAGTRHAMGEVQAAPQLQASSRRVLKQLSFSESAPAEPDGSCHSPNSPNLLPVQLFPCYMDGTHHSLWKLNAFWNCIVLVICSKDVCWSTKPIADVAWSSPVKFFSKLFINFWILWSYKHSYFFKWIILGVT